MAGLYGEGGQVVGDDVDDDDDDGWSNNKQAIDNKCRRSKISTNHIIE